MQFHCRLSYVPSVLEIEAHLHTEILTLLAIKLPLGGEASVPDERQTDVVRSDCGEGNAQFAGRAHPPVGGLIRLQEKPGDGTHLPRQQAPGPAEVVQAE